MNTVGVVDESVTVRCDPRAVWASLTRVTHVRPWWGALDQDLDAIAVQATLQTGSYSFYRLWVERLTPPVSLELTCAYLGVAGPTEVRFDIAPLQGPGGPLSRLRLREVLPVAEPADVHLAAELWRYRIARLSSVLDGAGVPSEPDELVLSRALPNPIWRPLHRSNIAGWLPVSSEPGVARRFYVVDSVGSRPFPVTSWQAHYDERLLLGIAVGRPDPVTRAELAVVPGDGPTGLILRVTHRGWRSAGGDAEIREMVRSRFRATWRAALDRAVAGPPR